MSANTASHGQSGFMSVESIGNALFYLIMIGIAALVVSVVMNTGKGGDNLSAISMVRSNVQYVGTNVGSYVNAATIVLENTVPLLSPVSTPTTAGTAFLPSGNTITVAQLTGDSSQFTITLTGYDADMCRKYAYYGVGSNFISVITGGGTTLTSANIEAQCGAAVLPASIVLTKQNNVTDGKSNLNSSIPESSRHLQQVAAFFRPENGWT